MFTLKEYQQRTLDALRAYFAECVQIGNADTAFYEITRRTFGSGIPYRPVNELPGLPYVCLRLPTGGGKTLLACHAVSVASKEFLNADRAVVLWLVPSNAIREQTLTALRDLRHPYRQALDSTVGSVTILDVNEALYVQRATLDTDTTIIVSTMQAFRVEDMEGRKVYESSGALMGHFSGLPEDVFESLERHEAGSVAYSLANMLRLRRPIVIVDEAHNARTSLSFETLARFRPASIIEFTATPDTANNPSNVLHSVSAAELRAEAMIKIPIRLETRPQWKELLADAVGLLSRLDKAAKAERQETGEYIRPIMLLQAQPRREGKDTLTVEVVEKCLLEDHRIPAEQIARATGTDRGLEGVDLLSPDCPIRYVITVQALREGWDCPFAYILCSVTELRASTAVEQILGRVMRLPGAVWKVRGELNMAYAFAASQNFFEAANALADALVENGFNRQEAKDFILPAGAVQTELPYDPITFMGTTEMALHETPETAYLSPETAAKVTFGLITGTMTFKGVMDDRELEELKRCFVTPEGKATVEKLYRKSRGLPAVDSGAPAERGQIFSIPVLAVQQGELFEQFEDTHFLDMAWRLSERDASLSETEFPSKRPEGQQGEITISDRGQVEARFLFELHQQMTVLAADQGWTVSELVYWLDRTIRHPDITPTESGLFLARLVRSLLEQRRLGLDQLVQDKYRLKQAATAKIEEHRRQAHAAGYQALLLPDSPTPLVVTPDVCFSIDPMIYPYSTLYRGMYKFKKHYYPQVGDLREEGEEFECAQFIDSLFEVKFWVRNLERRPSHAFWLQTSSDRFYPDFVCLLNDGRYLVVEYKGEDRWSNDDSKEKRDVGGLWEARSSGLCLFVMPRGRDFNAIKAKLNQ